MTKLLTKLKKYKKEILEENFFRPVWYSIFINPYYINRSSLLHEIKIFAQSLDHHKDVLDVGCGLKPYQRFFSVKRYIGIDIEGGGHDDNAKIVDAFFDGKNIPYSSSHFDAVICTQVLEHAEDPVALLEECFRVLRKDGVILISMPFMYPEHEIPYDYQRYTQFQHTKLLTRIGFSHISVRKTTGFFGTFAQLFSIFIFESITFRASLVKTLLSIIVLAPIQSIGLVLDMIFSRPGPTMDYVVTAFKK